MKSIFLLPFLSALLLAAPAVQASVKKPDLVSRAVGQVAEHVITSREVVLCGVIERWMYALQDRPSETFRKQEKLSWFLKLDTEDFRAQLSRIMLDIMVTLEAETLAVAEVEDSEVQLKSTKFMIDFAGFPEWKKLGPTKDEVEKLVRRRLRSRAFLQFKTETSGALVSDDEARAYFEKNRMRFGNYPFQQFRNTIKEVLAQQRLESRLKDWFEILKKKHRVRFLNPPPASM